MTPCVQDKKTVKIGEYTLSGKVGQGGIAEIYRARQDSLDRDVAIKILFSKLTDDKDIVRRFERESIVIARLVHPNIVHIIDKGVAGGRYYFVMEYIDGTNLKEIIGSDKVSLQTKLEMIVQVCKGLDYAHKNGVIHRDVKPANILVDRQGNALVADFGIAQFVGAPESEMTSTDVIMGTRAYMSPEQRISSTNVDQTTDIYAVGIVLYEILVGKKPMGRFKMPGEINPQLGTRFDEIVAKCLSQEPKDRFQTAVELKDAILEAMGGLAPSETSDDITGSSSDSFMGKCRYLDTIRETRYSSTILVENKLNKKLYVIKKHSKGEVGRKEASMLKSLKHSNIINIHGAGGDSKSTVIVTEYAQGGSLADRMVRKYEWEKAFRIILQVAHAIDFAHKNNIVHGNLRPSNILFDADEVVKLTDFGMPVHYSGSGKKNWYSPPEHKQSRAGDIYGMGVILHQLVTGRNPAYDTASNLLLEDQRRILPDDVCRMVSKLLAIRVAHRYGSCEELLDDWDEFESSRSRRAPVKAVKQPQVPASKDIPVWIYAAVGGGIVILVLVVLYFMNLLG